MAYRISTEVVSGLIDALLARGYPTIEDVARLLCVSPRTLQRMLSGEGNSYSNLVERCRCKAACEALEQAREPMQDIAARLGYADASSFARAFRRWTGTAPRTWRKQSLRPAERSAQPAGSTELRPRNALIDSSWQPEGHL